MNYNQVDVAGPLLLGSVAGWGNANGAVYESSSQFYDNQMNVVARYRGDIYESVYVTLLRMAWGVPPDALKLDLDKGVLSFTGLGKAFAFDSFGQIRLDLKAPSHRFKRIHFADLKNVDPLNWKNKIVIVGVGAGLNDVHITPAGAFLGPELIASGLYQFLSGRIFKEVSKTMIWLFSLTSNFLILLTINFLPYRLFRWRKVFYVFFMLALFVAPIILFERYIYLEQAFLLVAFAINALFVFDSPPLIDTKNPQNSKSQEL
ncbi:MAG: CHASE2 domain-containing protein [Spirochaetia bacterium]|nr:CHASE2 domain-containing protein [Spirochaetia bacterium]